MLRYLSSLLPPVLLFLHVFFIEFFGRFRPARDCLFILLVVSVVHSSLFPPLLPPLAAHVNGFALAIYLMRALELMVIANPFEFKRIQKLKSHRVVPRYTWEPLPGALGIQRALWALDLIVNIRALGWSHGPVDHLPPAKYIRVKPRASSTNNDPTDRGTKSSNANSNSSFAKRQAWRIATTYIGMMILQQTRFLMDRHHVMDGPISVDQLLWGSLREIFPGRRWLYFLPRPAHFAVIWATLSEYYWGRRIWLAIGVELLRIVYRIVTLLTFGSLLLLSQETMAFLAVGVLGDRYLGAWGEAWMYPEFIVPLTSLLTSSPKEFWGKRWHDLFRRNSLIIAEWMLIPGVPQLDYPLVVSIPFVWTALAHGVSSYAVTWNASGAVWMMVYFLVQPAIILLGDGSVFQTTRQQASSMAMARHFAIGIIPFYCNHHLMYGDLGLRPVLDSIPVPRLIRS